MSGHRHTLKNKSKTERNNSTLRRSKIYYNPSEKLMEFDKYFVGEKHINNAYLPGFVDDTFRNIGLDNIYISDYLRSGEAIVFDRWLNIQINIAESIKQLHSRDLVCVSLQNSDILINKGDGRVRIADYGRFCNLRNLSISCIDIPYLYRLDNYSPEMGYLGGLVLGLDIGKIVSDICEKPIIDRICNLYPSVINAEDEMNLFAKLNKMPVDIVDFVKKYSKATDMWAVGVILLKMYLSMITDTRITRSGFFIKNHRNQMGVFKGLLRIDPRFRYTVDDLFRELYTLRIENVP